MPAKRKKSEGQSAGNAVKAKKSKTETEAVAAGGDGSDSDSSLDVEKWRKLLLQMTGRCVVCVRERHTEHIVCVKALDEVVLKHQSTSKQIVSLPKIQPSTVST